MKFYNNLKLKGNLIKIVEMEKGKKKREREEEKIDVYFTSNHGNYGLTFIVLNYNVSTLYKF